jgi:hypothetical protein
MNGQACVGGRVTHAALLACAMVLLLGGCGWTPRDEFLRDRSVTVSSAPGDGSTITSGWRDSHGRYAQSPEVAARFESR